MARQYTLHKSTPSHASGIDYAAALNAEQYAAVSSPPGENHNKIGKRVAQAVLRKGEPVVVPDVSTELSRGSEGARR